jgi:hypothetical protein
MVPSIKYRIACQADQQIHPINITPDKYLVGIWLIRQYHLNNIGWTVRLTNRYTHQIFGEYPADPTVLPTKYGMDC